MRVCLRAHFCNLSRTVSRINNALVRTEGPYEDQKTCPYVAKLSDTVDGLGAMLCIRARLEQVR